MGTSPPQSSTRRLLQKSGLASSHQPIDARPVSTLLERHYDVRGNLEPLATEKDDTFRIRADSSGYLVKVSPPDEEAIVVALQTATMRFLEDNAPELPVQRVKLTVNGNDHVVVDLDDGTTRVLRVFNFVEGPVLSATSPDQEQLAKLGQMLGRVDLALARFAHPADQRVLVWDIRHFHQLAGLVEHTPNAEHRHLAREMFRLFQKAVVPRLDDLETQVIHGDYSPHNVVVDPQRPDFVTGIIDFGDTVRSAVIFDPAVTMANLLGCAPDDPWREACAFAAGYQQARPINESELALLPVAALARLTLRALITNWRAERVPARREYLLAHAKDDWTSVAQAMSAPRDDVLAQLRAGRS